MSTITHHIPVTTGQAHHMTLRLVQSYGAPAALSDYTVYGNILQDGETVPVSVTGADASGILLTIPPLYPGSHPYNLHLKHNVSGTDYLFLQGNCNVSELIGTDTLDNTAVEQITVSLKDDLSGVTVTVQIHSDNTSPTYPDMDSLLDNPEFLQRLKEACGIPALEEVISTKADTEAVAMSLAAKADTAVMNEALARKANQTDLDAGLASKADATALTAYIPYTKLGRALTKASDGTIDVDLSYYTGSTVNIIGTTSARIGRSSSECFEITSNVAQMRHNVKSEILRGNTYINVTTGAFVLKTGTGSTDATISAQTNVVSLEAKDQVAMRAFSGNYPGLFIRGAFNNNIFNDVQIAYNATSTFNQVARFGVSGNQINSYTTFSAGHN